MTRAKAAGRADAAGVRPLRCGVVGVGRMGRHHARVYSTLPESELVGVVDADGERAEEIAEKHGCRVFERPDDLIEAGVDAVSIAVPTVAHGAAAGVFLEAGIGCLVEKPLAEDVPSAERIKEHAEAAGVCLMVGHIERFNPAIRAVARLREKGHRFPPRFIEVQRVSPMTFRSVDIGVVMDMMIHDLDVVLWLVGGVEPVEVTAAGVGVITEHEDICNARLRFETANGPCVANMSASRLAMKTERITRITGEDGYIKIDYAEKTGTAIHRTANEAQRRELADQLRAGRDLSDLNWTELVNIEPLEIDNADQLEMEIREFLRAVRTGEQPEVDAAAGLANIRTAERIVAATTDFMDGVTQRMDSSAAGGLA